MSLKIHFIAGLPRSGSSLLAAILRQNPCFHAAMSTPVADLFRTLLNALSAHEGALFISAAQREALLRGLLESYYADMTATKVIFDTNRTWCSMLPAISQLFPAARVICLVRNPAWILDSVERAVQRNPLVAPKMFGNELTNVYNRTESMIKSHFLGPSLSALRQAWYSEHARRLIAIRYDSLTENPAGVADALYDALGEERFAHDFEHLDYDEPEFDARLGMPGFHKVGARVKAEKRETILPPDIFNQHNQNFWELLGQNPRGVMVL